MTRKRWLAVMTALGAAAAMAACKDQSVRDYLGNTGPGSLYEWERRVADAVCQLEEQNPSGLVPGRRICPNGSGGSGDKTSPPKYP